MLILSQYVSVETFKKDTQIFDKDDAARAAYIVARGKISIQLATPYGPYHLAELGPGEVFGENGYVDGGPRSSQAFSTESTDLLILEPDRLRPLLEQDMPLEAALFWAFWHSLSRKLRAANDKAVNLFAKGEDPNAGGDTLESRIDTGSFQLQLGAKRQLFQEQKLSTMEINFLSSLSRERKVAAEEVVFREGDLGDKMYVVLDGRVRISKHIGDGEEALGFAERGDYFGEMALIDEQPRSATATAHDKGAVLLSIPRDVLRGLIDVNRLSSTRLLKILCRLISKRLREVDDKLFTWFMFSGGELR